MKLSKIVALGVVALSLGLAGCANTVRGVGKDVKDTGRAVQSL